MGRFHINEAGEPGACRAKKHCPFGGLDSHFETKVAAREFYEKFNEMEQALQGGRAKPSAATDAAFASSLTYNGKPPRWFKNVFKEGKERYKHFGTEPELIDVIDGPQGKLAVIWEPHSVEDNDVFVELERGYVISRLTYRDIETGEVKAYLKSSRISLERAALSYGTDEWAGLRFMDDQNGTNALHRTYPHTRRASKDKLPERVIIEPYIPGATEDERLAQKKKIWSELHRRKPGAVSGKINTWNSKAVETLTEEQLEQDIAAQQVWAKERLAERIEDVATPFIDYVKLEEDLRGKGMGHSLYIYSARLHAKYDNLPLHSSGVQSDEAVRSWRRMGADPRMPLKVVKKVYRHEGSVDVAPRYELDFTEKS